MDNFFINIGGSGYYENKIWVLSKKITALYENYKGQTIILMDSGECIHSPLSLSKVKEKIETDLNT